MKLTETLMEMEQRFEGILKELRDLKMYVYALEQQNEMLLARVYNNETEDRGYNNLQKLYEKGFHICPAQFGGIRSESEGCLFCLGFLKKQLSTDRIDTTMEDSK